MAWNSFSRVGVIDESDGDYQHSSSTPTPPQAWPTKIGITSPPENARPARITGPGFPYYLRPGAKTLMIGPGGGYDVARALASGSRDITAVEINPIIANKIMRDRFAAESHRFYFRPEVHLVIEDGRSFVRRSTEKYQVLQATLVDTWASTAAGAFALSENNLYTTDAFYDYLTHLTDDGILVFTRWGFDPPRESLRLVTLAMDALARVGETDPARHVMVVRDEPQNSRLGRAGYGSRFRANRSRMPTSRTPRSCIAETKLEACICPATARTILRRNC